MGPFLQHSSGIKNHGKSLKRNYEKIFTVSFADLDQGREMITFKSILTTFEASYIFEAAGVVSKIGLSLKLFHQIQI